MQLFFDKYYYWLTYASAWSVLIPLLFSIYLLRSHGGYMSSIFRSVFLYIAFIAVVEALGILSIKLGTSNNLWISYAYVPIEYVLLAWVYYMRFEEKKIRTGIKMSVFLFLGFCLMETYWGAGSHQINSYSRVLESTLLIALALLYLYVLYKDLNYVYLEQDPMFVLSCGVLIFFAGTAMAYGMFNKALAISDNMARVCLSITHILIISFNCLLVVVQRKAATA